MFALIKKELIKPINTSITNFLRRDLFNKRLLSVITYHCLNHPICFELFILRKKISFYCKHFLSPTFSFIFLKVYSCKMSLSCPYFP